MAVGASQQWQAQDNEFPALPNLIAEDREMDA